MTDQSVTTAPLNDREPLTATAAPSTSQPFVLDHSLLDGPDVLTESTPTPEVTR